MNEKIPPRPVAFKVDFFKIASVPLLDAWTDFILSRHAKQCTPQTLRNYQVLLGRFIQWLETEQGIQAPQDLTARHIRLYLAGFADKSDWYLNDIARAIRTLVRFWHKEGYLSQAITFDLPKVRQKRLPFLSAEQVKRVLDACDLRERAILAFLVDSGLRLQEVCNLNRSDIDLQTGIVNVRQGKGRKDRVAVIGATTRRLLLKYFATQANQTQDAPAFQTAQGKRFALWGFQSLIRRMSKKAGVKFSAHALRRTFATLALQGGMDLVSLQTLLGHSDVSTTRKYVQWLDGDLLEAHRKASPIDKLIK